MEKRGPNMFIPKREFTDKEIQEIFSSKSPDKSHLYLEKMVEINQEMDRAFFLMLEMNELQGVA